MSLPGYAVGQLFHFIADGTTGGSPPFFKRPGRDSSRIISTRRAASFLAEVWMEVREGNRGGLSAQCVRFGLVKFFIGVGARQ